MIVNPGMDDDSGWSLGPKSSFAGEGASRALEIKGSSTSTNGHGYSSQWVSVVAGRSYDIAYDIAWTATGGVCSQTNGAPLALWPEAGGEALWYDAQSLCGTGSTRRSKRVYAPRTQRYNVIIWAESNHPSTQITIRFDNFSVRQVP